jgi:AbiV family abortive infection protein
MYSRAYLLAHFCFEELGKIPIIIGVVVSIEKGESVDWKQVNKRFSSHVEKITMQNGHFYAFGPGRDTTGDENLQWLIGANKAIRESYEKKNLSTYVDARDGKISRPSQSITKEDAERLVAFAFECLRAHRRSESLTNPVIFGPVESGTVEEGAYWAERRQS